jgi:hypothetical protein
MWQMHSEFNHTAPVVDVDAVLNANHALTEIHVIQFDNKRRQKTSSYGDKQIGIVNSLDKRRFSHYLIVLMLHIRRTMRRKTDVVMGGKQ